MENMENILLETERLLLRAPEEGDSQSLERVFGDLEMMHYLGGAWDKKQVAESLQWWCENWGINNCWYGTLLRKDTLETIGMAGFTENSIQDESGLELSWFVLPEHQKLGFASEITKKLLYFAFDDLKAKRVLAETHPQNPAAGRVLKKLSFKSFGERQHSYDHLPDFDTQVLWELSGERWLQNTN